MISRHHKIHAAVFGAVVLAVSIAPVRSARADMWGGDIPILLNILTEAIDEVFKLQQLVGQAEQTVNILEDMNRGVKEVLRLADTAHVPLPPGVLAQAKSIDQATWKANSMYGGVGDTSPSYTRTHYQSGVEALSLSQDAFDYSTFLDDKGEKIKQSAVVANQASATRLTAESLGVLLHAVSHSNRLEAKELELGSTERLESSAKEGARFDSFINTHQHIQDEMTGASMSSLNEVSF